MISVLLAEKLKSEGFPQEPTTVVAWGPDGKVLGGTYLCRLNGNECGVSPLRAEQWRRIQSEKTEETTKMPTLSELIEACGDGTGVFRISDAECNAWNTKLDKVVDDESNDFNYFRGTTPEEAVALLWLSLQKNRG